jgi:hypothetical protein
MRGVTNELRWQEKKDTPIYPPHATQITQHGQHQHTWTSTLELTTVLPQLQYRSNQHTTASTTGHATRHSRGTAYLRILINGLLRWHMGHGVVPSPRPAPATPAGLLPPTAWTRTCTGDRPGAQLLLGLGGSPLPIRDDLLRGGGAGTRSSFAAQAPAPRRQSAALAGCCGRRAQTVRQGEK